jgi:broad specificity phosphatase PhoE
LFYLLSAETNANSEGIIQGLTDTELSNIGYLQAQALGRHLQYHRFSYIFSSDLKRAAEVRLPFSFRLLTFGKKYQMVFSSSL